MDISVVIPTYNRSDALALTLEHLSRQDFSGTWEVIVVNNNSTDDTDEIVNDWKAKFPVGLSLLYEQKPGPAAARNTGAQAARGRYLIFIDNDILAEPTFVARHFDNVTRNPKHWYIGRIRNAEELKGTPFGRFRDRLQESFHVDLPTGDPVEYMGATGANWCMSHAEFDLAGGYDESFSTASCEDIELAIRARSTGCRTMYDPRICVIHNDWAIDLPAYLRRQELYCLSSVLFYQKYGDASPQKETVILNGPIRLFRDPTSIIFRKLGKMLFSTHISFSVLKSIALILERFLPDSSVSHTAYRFVTSLAIYKGVHDGFRRYGEASINEYKNKNN